MKHQQSSYQTDRKAGKYLTQCMMSQNNPCGTQYTCNQDKQAQPCYGIITEQRTGQLVRRRCLELRSVSISG